jgi:acetyltransferase-like isoleucine patch superfamily enzyme
VITYPGPAIVDLAPEPQTGVEPAGAGVRTAVVDGTATVAQTAVIAAANRKLQEGEWFRESTVTTIGPRADIGHFSLVGEGATVGADTIVDAYVHIEGGATLGERVIATHRATIGARARIGDDSVIGGFICDRSVVGNRCRVFGALVHRQYDPTIPWDAPEAEEHSPVIADGAFVGFGAKVIGGVEIGAGAYVCAGAIVTRSVPPHHIASGVNSIVPPERWGGGLHTSPFFSGGAISRAKWIETLRLSRWSAAARARLGVPTRIAG